MILFSKCFLVALSIPFSLNFAHIDCYDDLNRGGGGHDDLIGGSNYYNVSTIWGTVIYSISMDGSDTIDGGTGDDVIIGMASRFTSIVGEC
jgi:hypothetical protein